MSANCQGSKERHSRDSTSMTDGWVTHVQGHVGAFGKNATANLKYVVPAEHEMPVSAQYSFRNVDRSITDYLGLQTGINY